MVHIHAIVPKKTLRAAMLAGPLLAIPLGAVVLFTIRSSRLPARHSTNDSATSHSPMAPAQSALVAKAPPSRKATKMWPQWPERALRKDGETYEELPPRLTAEETKDALLATVHEGGPSWSETWTASAQHALQSLSTHVPQTLSHDVQWSSIECYRGGCTMEATYTDRSTLAQLDTVLLSPESEFVSWGSVKFRTGPIANGRGQITSTWAVLPPRMEEKTQ